MKILDSKERSSGFVLDAVTIIKQTNDTADGKLSQKARQTLKRFEKLKTT